MISANKRPEFLETAVPAAVGIIAAPILWTVSYKLAAAVGGGTFIDVWLGGAAIISGLGAIISTIVAVVASACAYVVAVK